MSRLPGIVAGLLLAASLSLPARAEDDAAERVRIAAERQAVDARFESARRVCETRFAVTGCLEQARQDRRQALEPLQRQLHLLDDARRRQRAAERLQSIREREAAAATRPALAASASDTPTPSVQPGKQAARTRPAAASSTSDPSGRMPLQRTVRPAGPGGSATPALSAASAAEAAQDRQRRASRFQQRQQEAQAHEEAVKARNARHDAQRTPAAGLPVPVPPASSSGP